MVALLRLVALVLRLSGLATARQVGAGITATGDGWRVRIGSVTLDALAAEAEAARQAGVSARTYARPPAPVWGFSFTREF